MTTQNLKAIQDQLPKLADRDIKQLQLSEKVLRKWAELESRGSKAKSPAEPTMVVVNAICEQYGYTVETRSNPNGCCLYINGVAMVE